MLWKLKGQQFALLLACNASSREPVAAGAGVLIQARATGMYGRFVPADGVANMAAATSNMGQQLQAGVSGAMLMQLVFQLQLALLLHLLVEQMICSTVETLA
jgi:hypothetical protein